jgi:hypothetical protein
MIAMTKEVQFVKKRISVIQDGKLVASTVKFRIHMEKKVRNLLYLWAPWLQVGLHATGAVVVYVQSMYLLFVVRSKYLLGIITKRNDCMLFNVYFARK